MVDRSRAGDGTSYSALAVSRDIGYAKRLCLNRGRVDNCRARERERLGGLSGSLEDRTINQIASNNGCLVSRPCVLPIWSSGLPNGCGRKFGEICIGESPDPSVS